MGNVDELMATCPLKQYIREHLWEAFIKKLKRKPISYLTFYAPTIMDVKHFTEKGYIKFEEMVYKDVVGITNDETRGYPETIKEGRGRLEVLKIGEAHELIMSLDKDLMDKFPFDVINLDYCNYIFGDKSSPYISNNLKDISLIIKHQNSKGCNEFILFITTRTDKSKPLRGKADEKISFAESFINELKNRIQLNMKENVTFQNKYNNIFSKQDIDQVAELQYNDFINIGIAKLISMELATNGYTIKDCNSMWLIRNEKKPQRDLLHMAIHAVKGKVSNIKTEKLNQYGSYLFLEGGVTVMLDKIKDKEINLLAESKDKERLTAQLGTYMKQLRDYTFEIKIPEPLTDA